MRVFTLSFSVALTYVFVLALYILSAFPQYVEKGIYFQQWTSEGMMQTLPIRQLRDAPLENLYYLHIQPPMLDTIRAIIAQFSPKGDEDSLEHFVDATTEILWAGLFAILAALVHHWIKAVTGSLRLAKAAFLFWLCNPGALPIITLFDSTLLSSLYITWLLYEIWGWLEQRGSEKRLTLAAMACFLTRTVFQWPFFVLFPVFLYCARIPLPSLRRISLPVLLVVSLYVFKQFMLFGTMNTASFAGEHKLGVIQYHQTDEEVERYRQEIPFHYPDEARKFAAKYNTPQQAKRNLIYGRIFSERLDCCLQESLQGLAESIRLNVRMVVMPTSGYNDRPFMKAIVWRDFYDALYTKPIFITVFLGVGMWLFRHRRDIRTHVHYFVPAVIVVYISAVLMTMTARYDWTEVHRLKFLLDPTFFVFSVCQFSLFIRELKEMRLRQRVMAGGAEPV